jgi:predicted RNA-binding Zn-ribbon protein involved in translation (DUF1610 family)/F0F1-type ATP synthase assembly protein I
MISAGRPAEFPFLEILIVYRKASDIMTAELDAAIQQIKAGQSTAARQILVDLLRKDSHNEDAWMWLSSVVEDDYQRRDCLERALAIDPGNEAARLQLNQMLEPSPYRSLHESGFSTRLKQNRTISRSDDVIETRLVTLACPSCGAALEITPDKDLYVCQACGNSHVVKRSAGMVALEPVLEQMREMRKAVSRSSREINIHRIRDEIEALEKEKNRHKKGLADGIKIVMVAITILVFLNIGYFFQPLIFLGLILLAAGLAFTSYHFIRHRQLETGVQMKQLEIIRERNY